ncbi:DMT family transporter [Aetokthonos hydrillicola]|uniref:DMT family transporter n=1 Tax=Aetokthonos hydrillicola TaxID=1550245 RepID=UPI002877F60D|nr:DMT family transporter [Aetokthonos hydrillicola]
MPGQIYLFFAVLIFGASSPVTRKITEIGAAKYVNGHNPVSLCNILFVGNICALLVLLILYGREWSPSRLKLITRNQWLYLSITSIIGSALVPALIFQALATTNVNNIVLIGRVEPALTIAFSIWLLREQINIWGLIGASVSFLGVFLTIALPSHAQDMMVMKNMFTFGTGEICTIIASFAGSISTIIAKGKLLRIPLGIYTIYRTSLGTVIFFSTALILYGQHHFMEAFSPFLWKWMLIYGPVIVVLGQSSWTVGSRLTSVAQASLIGSFTPIIAVITAYLILGEAPTFAQYVGGTIVVFGIMISQFGVYRQQLLQRKNLQDNSIAQLREVESKIGFKGM